MLPLQALTLLLEGKKIRKNNWNNNNYIYLNSDDCIKDELKRCAVFTVHSNTDIWEEYIPKLSWKDIEVGMDLFFTASIYKVSFKNDYVFLITHDQNEEFFTVVRKDFEQDNSCFKKAQ